MHFHPFLIFLQCRNVRWAITENTALDFMKGQQTHHGGTKGNGSQMNAGSYFHAKQRSLSMSRRSVLGGS